MDAVVMQDLRFKRDVYTLLSRVFAREIDEETLRVIRDVAEGFVGHSSIQSVADTSTALFAYDATRLVDEGFALIARCVSDADCDMHELNADYTNVFLGFGPTLASALPYESCWREGGRTLLGEPHRIMSSLLHEEGLEPAGGAFAAADHVATELSLLAHYADRACAAVDFGDELSFDDTCARYSRFFEEHPGLWVDAWCDEAASASFTDFYRGFALVAKGMMAFESWPEER